MTPSDSPQPAKKRGGGTKPLIFGIVLTLLALLNIAFSLLNKTTIDPFYLLLTALGIALAMFGACKKGKPG
ncbi:MAG: hypothetical protein HOC23_22645 [Halieaceae bacterium]|nr:hypothetical protein [Halieaceae bacterium]